MTNSPDTPTRLGELKSACTAAFQAVKKAASSLRTAVKQGQTVILECVQRLELCWSEFEFSYEELCDFISNHDPLPEGEVASINGTDINTYHHEAESLYVESLRAYKA